MATRVVETVVDDLDGTEVAPALAERVTLMLDGETVELDLSPRNARHLRAILAPHIRAADRRRSERERSGYRVTRLQRAVPVSVLRRWAVQNGYEVSPRGSVPKGVREAFDAAH